MMKSKQSISNVQKGSKAISLLIQILFFFVASIVFTGGDNLIDLDDKIELSESLELETDAEDKLEKEELDDLFHFEAALSFEERMSVQSGWFTYLTGYLDANLDVTSPPPEFL